MKHAKCYKKGYPRPRFVRDNFTSLDGEWNFAFDDENVGERKKWYKTGVNDLKINVPFAYQCALSGINVDDRHETVWYSRTFTAVKKRNKRLLVNFEGADHEAKVWLNGELLGTHAGGYARFTFDLTDHLKNGENLLVVRCVDRRSALTVRGKQRYVEKNISCFYTDTTGIWKPVWLEEVGDGYLFGVSALCNYSECEAVVEYKIQRFTDGLSLETRLYFDDEFVHSTEVTCDDDYGKIKLDLTLKNKVLPMKPWSAGRSGQFFDVEYILKKNGIDPKTDLTMDQSIQFGLTAAAFTSDQSDYTVEFEPFATGLELEGNGYVVASLGTDSGYVPYTAYCAKKSYLAMHPDLIQRFTSALQKGMDYVNSHTAEEIAKTIQPQFSDTPLENITKIVKRYQDQDTWKENLIFERSSFELLENILEEAGELQTRVPYENLVTTEFAEQAVK